MKHPLHILNVLSLRVNISIAEPGIILPSSHGVECRRVQRFLLPGYLRPREFPLNFPFTFGPVTTTTVKPKCHQTITPRRQKKKCQALLRKPCLSISSNNRKQPRKHTKNILVLLLQSCKTSDSQRLRHVFEWAARRPEAEPPTDNVPVRNAYH